MDAKDTVLKVAEIPIGMPTRTYEFSPEELRKELGIQAEISFRAGIKEVGEWLANLTISGNAVANELRIVEGIAKLKHGKMPKETKDSSDKEETFNPGSAEL